MCTGSLHRVCQPRSKSWLLTESGYNGLSHNIFCNLAEFYATFGDHPYSVQLWRKQLHKVSTRPETSKVTGEAKTQLTNLSWSTVTAWGKRDQYTVDLMKRETELLLSHPLLPGEFLVTLRDSSQSFTSAPKPSLTLSEMNQPSLQVTCTHFKN